MRQVPLLFPFALALSGHFALPLLFPSLRFLAFAPFLVVFFMRKPLITSLWMAALAGLIVDLTSTTFRLGVFSLAYALTALFCHRKNQLFF